jgi:hypothetical protein
MTQQNGLFRGHDMSKNKKLNKKSKSPNSTTPDWKSYEDIVRSVLTDLKSHFGLKSVEPKAGSLPGESGGKWNIEIVATSDDDGTVIVECRKKRKRKVEQEEMLAFTARVEEVGAKRGVFVTTKGLQKGAKLLANAKNIQTFIFQLETDALSYIGSSGKSNFAMRHSKVGMSCTLEMKVTRAKKEV